MNKFNKDFVFIKQLPVSLNQKSILNVYLFNDVSYIKCRSVATHTETVHKGYYIL